tara:strand:- start:7139 stop:8110 length:972 start_codon:yes stop_codon:yes gene_type:complete
MSFEDQIKYVGYAGKSPKPATIRKVARDIKNLYEQIYDIDQNFHWKKYQVMLMDPEVLLEGLDEMKGRKDAQLSLNSRIGYLQSCLIGLKSFGLEGGSPFEVINEVYMDYQTERIMEDTKNPPTLDINREEIDKVVEKHKHNLKKWLILKLYTTYNFRLEVATLEQISEEEFSEGLPDYKLRNFIVVGPSLRFVFNKYKTSGRYGTRTIVIEDGEFKDRLIDFLKTRDKKEFVFFEMNWEKIEATNVEERRDKVFVRLANNLSKFIQRTFKEEGMEINATKLAKLIESEAWATGDLKLVQKVAQQRGHKVETAGKVYAINKTN